jgi:glycosyltransferase involved in cell wall biosynthesis
MGTVVIATVNREQGSTGVHTHTRALRDGLVAAGVAVDLVTPFSGSRGWLPLFAVRPLLLNRLHPTWATLWYRRWHGAAVKANLRRRLARGGVDQIIAQCPVSAAAALSLRGSPGCTSGAPFPPVTIVCHFNHSEAAEYRDQGVLAGEANYRRMLAGEDDVLRRVDRAVYVSEWAKEIVERDRGLTPRATAVIRNGIAEVAPISPVTRESIGLSADDVVLMSVGTLEPRKNQIALIEAVARLDRATVKLVLVGEGPDRPKLERRIAELELTGRVLLLGHRSDVPALLALADIYVHGALAENCPVAVIEAARAGLPWAAVPAAGIVELQQHLGGCVPLDELPSLVADAERRSELGRAAAANFRAGFTRTAMVRRYMDVLGIATG